MVYRKASSMNFWHTFPINNMILPLSRKLVGNIPLVGLAEIIFAYTVEKPCLKEFPTAESLSWSQNA